MNLQVIYVISVVTALLFSISIMAIEDIAFLFNLGWFNPTIIAIALAFFITTYLMFYFGKHTGLFEEEE